MKSERRPRWSFVLASGACLCYVLCSVFFVMFMLQKNQQENEEVLFNFAQQSKVAIEKQVSGDFQTLEGLAICFAASEEETGQIDQIVKTINDHNAFIRMGYAAADGTVEWFDIDGLSYTQNDLLRYNFFEQALNGTSAVSATYEDPYSDGYVNYYAVPVTKNGQVIGVLCATHSSEQFRGILDSSISYRNGFSSLVDSNGDLIIRSQEAEDENNKLLNLSGLGEISQTQYQEILKKLSQNERYTFSYERNGTSQLAVVEPVDINNWFVCTSVPKSALNGTYRYTILGICCLSIAAFIIFAFLLARQRRMSVKNRAALMHLAYDDQLTGCRNFTKFLLDAQTLLETYPGKDYAIWYCDVKKFKYINDLYSYQTGDQLLRGIAQLLKQEESENRLFGRVNADNFVGIQLSVRPEELTAWFEQLTGELKTKTDGMLQRLSVELTMGVYYASDSSGVLTVNDMVNRANMAQKSVKQVSGSQIAFFTEEIREQILDDAEMELEGKRGLEAGEFVPYFQPKVNIQNGSCIVGAEVLARWNHPEKGLVSPGRFIPLFERTGMIVQLDRMMFEQACRWFAGYLKNGGARINVAINVSRLGLLQKDFIPYYTAVKNRWGIADGLLELEFTESVILEDDQLFLDTVRQLQANGFVCSLDDFGAGYSSLNLLKNLPIDVLKLDILFFRNSLDLSRERIVISSILHMAKLLHIRTIAEGVEDMENIEFLQKAGCDVVQGYVFFKPMPLAKFQTLLGSLESGPAEKN